MSLYSQKLSGTMRISSVSWKDNVSKADAELKPDGRPSRYDSTDIATDEEMEALDCSCAIHTRNRQPMKVPGIMEQWFNVD